MSSNVIDKHSFDVQVTAGYSMQFDKGLGDTQVIFLLNIEIIDIHQMLFVHNYVCISSPNLFRWMIYDSNAGYNALIYGIL